MTAPTPEQIRALADKLSLEAHERDEDATDESSARAYRAWAQRQGKS